MVYQHNSPMANDVTLRIAIKQRGTNARIREIEIELEIELNREIKEKERERGPPSAKDIVG